MVVHPCHQCEKLVNNNLLKLLLLFNQHNILQASLIGSSIGRLKFRPEDKNVDAELKDFQLQLINQKIVLSSFGFFIINHQLLVSVTYP